MKRGYEIENEDGETVIVISDLAGMIKDPVTGRLRRLPRGECPRDFQGVTLLDIVQDQTPPDDFAHQNGMQFRVDGDVIRAGFVPTDPDILQQKLIDHAAEIRWRKETGGILMAGVKVDTSRESQSMINGAFNRLSAGFASEIKFKTRNGFMTFDLDQMTALARLVSDHVQDCFQSEATLVAAIQDGTITTKSGVEGWTWPEPFANPN